MPNHPPARSTVPAPPAEITVKISVCPECTRIAGDTRHRVKDPKGVHKCQICRSEMTDAYKAKLPEIKAHAKEKFGVR